MKHSIIPIFIPHIGCPYRCVFCNQWKITGQHHIPTGQDAAKLIKEYTLGIEEKRYWEVAFYGGSFTAIPIALQEELLQPAYEALQQGRIQGIRCSTRPDCITDTILQRLQRYGMKTVELGVQSLDDVVLKAAKRGHTAADVVEATRLLREYGFTVGHQLMPGLPNEDWQSLKYTTAKICNLKPDISRIYPVVVIAQTELAELYCQGTYTPLSIAEGIRRAAYMKQQFLQHGIDVIRTGLQATTDLDDGVQVLAGAYTPALGELVDTYRYGRQIFSFLRTLPRSDTIRISYHRKETSRVRGYHGVTQKQGALQFGNTLQWCEDNTQPLHTICVTLSRETWRLWLDEGRKERID